MIQNLVTTAFKNRFLTFTLLLFSSLWAFNGLKHITIDAVPDITNVQVIINTKTYSLDPSKVETLVSYQIENEMLGIQGVQEVRSLSKYGLSQVVLSFSDNTPIASARQLVLEKLQGLQSALPAGLIPTMAPVTTGLGEVFMYAVEPKENSELAKKSQKEQLMVTREIQDYVIRPYLKRIQGVADVDTNGGLSKQIHINFTSEKLQRYGLSIEDLIKKFETMGENFGGGQIEHEGNQLIVRTVSNVDSIEAISKLPIFLDFKGKSILIKDIAQVRLDYAQRTGAATYNGHETVLGTVLMRTGANGKDVSTLAKKAIESEIQLPKDIQIKVLYSREKLVSATIHTVMKNLIEGTVLVLFVLLIVLGHLRASLIVALSIPLSMLFAFKGMQLFGISANLMSLGAIDFGLLVDAAVVLIENIIHRFEGNPQTNLSKKEKFDIVLNSSVEVLKPLVYGLVIIMLVYFPILSFEGTVGKMFKPMATTVLLALFSSLVIALFLMPTLAYLFIPLATKKEKPPFFFRLLLGIYTPVLSFSLKRPWLVPTFALGVGVLALYLSTKLGTDFVPKLDEGDMVINLTRPRQQSINQSISWQQRAEEIIQKHPEVELVFSRLGTSESGLDPMGPYLADTFVILKKPKVASFRSKLELFETIQKQLEADYPLQQVSLNQPIEMRFNEILEGSRADVSLRVYGPNLSQLMSYSNQAEIELKNLKGVASIESDPLTALATGKMLNIEIDYPQLVKYDLTIKEINSVLEAAMDGAQVGPYYENDRKFPIIVHLDESMRNDITKIGELPVALKYGGTTPLASVAKIYQNEQITTIARSGARRYSAISIFIKNQDLNSFVTQAKQRIQATIQLKPGYEFHWGGQFQNLDKATKQLMIIIPITLLIIFILLIQCFGNIRHAILVLTVVPLAMMGGVFSLYLRNINFSVTTSIGFITLAGIAILNSMVMVSFFNQLKAAGHSIKETIFEGALSRLRPVSMTALLACLGFLPMALSTGVGAEVQRPLATVVIGGLLTSTILTLLIIPILYGQIEKRS